jgi:hypothetical protein
MTVQGYSMITLDRPSIGGVPEAENLERILKPWTDVTFQLGLSADSMAQAPCLDCNDVK